MYWGTQNMKIYSKVVTILPTLQHESPFLGQVAPLTSKEHLFPGMQFSEAQSSGKFSASLRVKSRLCRVKI